jgi:hypothetical protein
MKDIRHPLSGAVYGREANGLVRVDHNGKVGWFRPDGMWVSGEIRSADPHLCCWVGGKDLPPGYETSPRRAQADRARKERQQHTNLAEQPTI